MEQMSTKASEFLNLSGQLKYDLDFNLTEKLSVYGGTVIAKGAKFGDYIKCSVCLPDNTTVGVFIEKLYMIPINDTYFSVSQISEKGTDVPAGFVLKLEYFSSDTTQRDVLVNYEMEKLI